MIGLVVIDAVKKLESAELQMVQKAKQMAIANPAMRLVLVLNKVDLVQPKTRLLEYAEKIWG
jgi:50S ribosomal subunit-associated GTPase HflX